MSARSIRITTVWAVTVATVAGCNSTTTRSTVQATRVTNRTAYYHTTIAAGPSLFTRENGTVLDERRHEPFGAPIGAIDYAVDPHNALNQETDVATGWSDHGARWLAPETARWLTPDPPVKAPDPAFMARPWSLHPYQYVEQNPIVFWDPDGREPEELPNCPAPPLEHHSAGDMAIHTVHQGVAAVHIAAGVGAQAVKFSSNAKLALGVGKLEHGGKAANALLAGYHLLAWAHSESGTEENYEHAGAAFTNIVQLLAPPLLSAAIAGLEVAVPNFHREIGRPITQADLQSAADDQWGARMQFEARLDETDAKLDTLLRMYPAPVSTPMSEPPVYGPPAPQVYGPPAPEPVSRRDPMDE
jgi:RHS repeat-associated protein